MTEIPDFPIPTREETFALHNEMHRARQLDQQLYTQAITDPEASRRYQTDLAFRLDIDLRRNLLHAAEEALADESVDLDTRNRILQRIAGRGPDTSVAVVYGNAAAVHLPHGPFAITYDLTGYRPPFDVELIARCRCDAAQKWNGTIPGGELLAFLSDHATTHDLGPTRIPPKTTPGPGDPTP